MAVPIDPATATPFVSRLSPPPPPFSAEFLMFPFQIYREPFVYNGSIDLASPERRPGMKEIRCVYIFFEINCFGFNFDME